MTNYTAGRRLEYAVARLYRDAGWQVSRTAGSHGVADVLALKLGSPPDLFAPLRASGWAVSTNDTWHDGVAPWNWTATKHTAQHRLVLWLAEFHNGYGVLVLIQAKRRARR